MHKPSAPSPVHSIHFCLSATRTPARAMLFPYTTLFRSSAVELDANLASAHVKLGYVRLFFDWDWSAAEREYRRALEKQKIGRATSELQSPMYLVCRLLLEKKRPSLRLTRSLAAFCLLPA